MNRLLYQAAFVAGLAAVCWVGVGYASGNPLALVMTVLIGAFYGMGALELHRYQQATASLHGALQALGPAPAALADWLATLHPSLRNAVRLRVEGERTGLPGPALTPYLAGLLVLLGMLGTFLGMVVTLKGTVMALEGTADLATLRASLAAPVKGLGLAFGTSVAGVCASAMLGLMSALCRRDRLQAAQALDTHIATTLRVFSRAHQRDQALQTLQDQARGMPELVDRLQAMMAQMERHSLQLNERLQANQAQFHQHAEQAYTALAASVDQTLRQSLADSARVAAATLQPAVQATLEGITRETATLHQAVAQTVQQHLDGVSGRLDAAVDQVAATWSQALDQQQRGGQALAADMRATLDHLGGGFDQRSVALLEAVAQSQARWQAEQSALDERRLSTWTQQLQAMTTQLQAEWQQAGLQSQAQLRGTLDEVGRLMHTAAEAPRVAAEVIAQLRQQLSSSLAQDNALLEERQRVMQTLSTLLGAVQHASTEQRAAIDALVASSAEVLQRLGAQFGQQVEAGSARIDQAAAQVAGSALEVASLGDAFGQAVQLFSVSNDRLVAQLQGIESALGRNLARSDEQLAYYVAQAREIIDLSLHSQKQIVDDLQKLARRPAALAGEAC